MIGVRGIQAYQMIFFKANFISRLFLWCYALTFMVFPLYAHDNDPEIHLETTKSSMGIVNFFVVDLNGDGQDDILEMFANGRGYMARTFSREQITGPALYQANFNHWIGTIMPADIDTLPGYEVIIAFKDEKADSLWLEVISGSDKTVVLCRTEAIHGTNISDRDGHEFPYWDGFVNKCYIEDLNDDGSPEIIAPLTVGFDLYPRGIYVFEYPSGKLAWTFPLAGNPLNLKFGDADRDGFLEIYFKTWACSNGAKVGDRRDTTAYAFALDHLGYQLWSAPLGDRFDFQTGDVHICDCDNDDTLEIYYSTLTRTDEFDKQVRILEKHRAKDNLFIRQKSFDAASVYREIYSADFNDDDVMELIVDNFPESLDPADLSTIRKGTLSSAKVVFFENIDKDKENRPEIVLKKADSVYIIDDHFDQLGAIQVGNGGHVHDVKYIHSPFGTDYLGVVIRSVALDLPVFTLRFYSITVVPAPTLVARFLESSRSVLPWLIIVFIFGLLVGKYLLGRTKPAGSAKKPKTAQYDNLLTALTDFDHGQMAGKTLNRLLFLFSNLPDSEKKFEEIKPNLKSTIEAYQSYTQTQLESIVEYSRKIKQLRPAVKTIEKQMGNLAVMPSNMVLTELTIKDGHELKSIIPEATTEIIDTIKELKWAVQPYFAVDLLRVVHQVITATAAHMRQQSVIFSEIISRGGGRVHVFFAEAELASIFEELFNNACTAMSETDTKELSIMVETDQDEVIFKLSDTGHGLQDKDVDRIFGREYSSKENGGYGLFHVRQQIERFGGRIRIYNNNGPGATVEFRMKAVKYE
jgi:signal transduction histidine kinase